MLHYHQSRAGVEAPSACVLSEQRHRTVRIPESGGHSPGNRRFVILTRCCPCTSQKPTIAFNPAECGFATMHDADAQRAASGLQTIARSRSAPAATLRSYASNYAAGLLHQACKRRQCLTCVQCFNTGMEQLRRWCPARSLQTVWSAQTEGKCLIACGRRCVVNSVSFVSTVSRWDHTLQRVRQASNASTCYDEEARAAAMETRTPEQLPRPIAKRHGSPPSATRCGGLGTGHISFELTLPGFSFWSPY